MRGWLELPRSTMSQPISIIEEAEQLRAAPTAQMRALEELPRVREAILRAGKTINMNRPVNQEAVIAQSRGDHPERPCGTCELRHKEVCKALANTCK